jgi:hypothetical protein
MTKMKTLTALVCMTGLSALALAQNAAATPPRITAADAKKYVDKTVMVCGKVVDSKVSKYGLTGHGKPINLALDQPEPNPVFYLVIFAPREEGAKVAVAAYQGKNVCVTGQINDGPPAPFILVPDRSQIKIQEDK